MDKDLLKKTTQQLVSEGHGVLATDATEGTMDKRLVEVGIETSPGIRREFRELLLTTAGIDSFISGVILNDEIIRQTTSGGIPFAKFVEEKGMLPGIKVDMKAHDMANFPGEKITEGLDGLRKRFEEYKSMGARFAKWRAVISIGSETPTATCINSNSESMARYSAIAQEAGIVPIAEPEVVMDGDHSIEKCAEVTKRVLKTVFKYLSDHKVYLEGLILKPNMVLPGSENKENVTSEEVAEKTLFILEEVVPKDVGGIVFLSGGQDPVLATERLNAMNKIGEHPWKLSFSFERALEGPAMKIWKQPQGGNEAAQKAFYHRAKMNSLATLGKYSSDLERENG